MRCRSCSVPLQRAITDFGSDVPFGKIPGKLREHYGIEVPVGSSRAITLSHAEEILKSGQLQKDIPERAGVAVLLAEIDGCMIPVVEMSSPANGEEKIDLRTTRKTDWKEARLCLTHPKGSITPLYGATIGTPEEAGDQLLDCAIRAGLGTQTMVHGVGDGAPWISDQFSLKFGLQGSYLIDFYHVCDYLSAAGDVCAPQEKKPWMEVQKQRMKDGFSSGVLEVLKPYLESESIKNKDAPVRACHRYIVNRPGQFDYKSAIAADLPIGSGEVESGHRYVIQARLKLSGAWWKPENAQSMLAIRVLRANGDWEQYWSSLKDKAA